MIGKQKRQLFPEKLWELVHDSTSGIQWSSDGKRIEIERSKLELYLLQHGTAKFRSNKYDSFIRQLHFYGFKKCGDSYQHELFQRATPLAHHLMKRKYSNCQATKPTYETPSKIELRMLIVAFHNFISHCQQNAQ